MMKHVASIVLALTVLIPSIASADATADHGKAVFVANNCYLCHGTAGQGGAGPTIAPPKMMPTYDSFAAWVRHPGAGVMPVYTAKVLSDADLTAIYGYLQSLKAPATIPAALTHP